MIVFLELHVCYLEAALGDACIFVDEPRIMLELALLFNGAIYVLIVLKRVKELIDLSSTVHAYLTDVQAKSYHRQSINFLRVTNQHFFI